MAKLETQINQIYLTHPDTKKTSLVLYEEALSSTSSIFVLAELRNLEKKSEAGDLKKISEIILTSFRTNKKLPGETLFETALAQINQNLADLAHDGRKSWVGKLSSLITLKSGDNIFVANCGQTTAWLRRKSDVMEIVSPEKSGLHPLKTFTNFSQGKLQDQDALIMTTANIFNFVSLSLFTKILAQNQLSVSCDQISKILQDSIVPEQAFCAFFVGVQKKVPQPETQVTDTPEDLYSPVPEELTDNTANPGRFRAVLSNIKIPQLTIFKPNLRLIKIPRFELAFFRKLSLSGKFFFISFFVFVLLFIITISVNGFKLRTKRVAESIENQVQVVSEDIALAQSALIYKNDQQAVEYLSQAQTDYEILKNMSPERAAEFEPKLEQLQNQVNKTSVANAPTVYAEFNRHPIYMTKSPTGFVLSGVDSNSMSEFDGTNKDYFLLNSLNQEITALAYWPAVKAAISVSDKIYRINDTLKQFESFISLEGSKIDHLKTYNNNLYALDTQNGRVIRITGTIGKTKTSTAISGDFTNVRDFAVDGDFYLLTAEEILKFQSGKPMAFSVPQMTDPITNATKIFVGNNIYILEATKKRVVIISKSGGLINQISFPSISTPLDLYVEESSRSMYILDDNKLYRIIF